jgi:hypothetical protein
MTFLGTKKHSSLVAALSILMVLGSGETTLATSFSPEPLFPLVNSYSTTIPTNGDYTDIYFPVISPANVNQQKSPIALLLPGSRVDTSQYSQFAQIVASYGFTVVVPERIRSLPDLVFTGLLPEASQINEVLDFIITENTNPNSPIAGTIDVDKLALLGHSFGGAVGLAAIDNSCIPYVCEGQFQRPEQLRAAAFFGTSIFVGTGQFIPINNPGIPIALLQGNQDGLVTPDTTQTTYDLIQEPPKALITVNGANHYGITNINNPSGARPDPNIPILSQDKAVETIARWSALFLRGYVLGDHGALNYVNNTGDRLDENVTLIRQVKTVPEANLVRSLFLSIFAFTILRSHYKLRG